MSLTVRQLLAESREQLARASVDSPDLSAQLLAAHVLGVQRFELHLNIDRLLENFQIEQIRILIRRRAKGEPVAYLLGCREFYGLDFKVTPDVLIPRPETEHIIEYCESVFSKQDSFVFADFGTGSGILATTLATLFPYAKGVAVDLFPGPLNVARSNAEKHGVGNRIQFVRADFTQTLFLPSSFDLVVANPPYVTEEELGNCSHEVRQFEPHTALTSGADGLDHIRLLIPCLERYLVSKGLLAIEFGWRHGSIVRKILASQEYYFNEISIHKDLAGHDRFVTARKK